MHGPHGHHGPHGPHGILSNFLPHNPIVHHLLRPKHHIVQKVNVNVYEQPQPSNQNNQYNYNYEEPYYDEEPGVEGAKINQPMSTDDYFKLKKQIEDEMSQREWDELKKKKEKNNDTKKETEDIKEQNNITQKPPLNPQEQPSSVLQPAPPINQQPEVNLPTLDEILSKK